MTRYANWQSDEVESLVFVGSNPTLLTQLRIVDFGLRDELIKSAIRNPKSAMETGSWSNGTTLARQARDPGSIPGESTYSEGSRIRLAGPVC
jgi:hypothetical protein